MLLAVSGTSNEYEPVHTSSCGELIQISLPLKKDSMTTQLTLTKEGSIYRFSKARAIVVGKNDIFIAENLQNGSVQKVNIQTEIVTTLCDNLRYPNSMVIWSTNPNILFVTLSSKYIFSIDVRTGKKETLCGTNKKNIEEPFGNMGSICCDDKGKLFVCELSKRRIRVVEVEKAANEQLKAKVSLLCGNKNSNCIKLGPISEASFDEPRSMAIDPNNSNLIIFDHMLLKIEFVSALTTSKLPKITNTTTTTSTTTTSTTTTQMVSGTQPEYKRSYDTFLEEIELKDKNFHNFTSNTSSTKKRKIENPNFIVASDENNTKMYYCDFENNDLNNILRNTKDLTSNLIYYDSKISNIDDLKEKLSPTHQFTNLFQEYEKDHFIEINYAINKLKQFLDFLKTPVQDISFGFLLNLKRFLNHPKNIIYIPKGLNIEKSNFFNRNKSSENVTKYILAYKHEMLAFVEEEKQNQYFFLNKKIYLQFIEFFKLKLAHYELPWWG